MANSAQTKEKNNRRDFLIALGLLLALLAVVAVIVFVLPTLSRTTPTDDPAHMAPEMPFDVPGFTLLENVSGTSFDNGLSVLCCGKYTGFFLEDGTDEQVQDVLAIVVKNGGSSLVEYGVIELPLSTNETAVFEFSGLPVGAAVLVQEKNRLTTTDGIEKMSFVCSQYALPAGIVLDFGSDFELYTDNGVINMKNISGADITTDVSVFYKNYEFGLFMGGITYRARVAGGIKAGEIGQALQNHFWLDTSAILYMSYGK